MADSDKSLTTLRYNQITQGLEGFGGGFPTWTPLTLVADGGINQLHGDASAGPGVGNQALTLTTVNSNVGSFTSANITVDAKGRITAAANGSSVVPGGINGDIQYNSTGTFAGAAITTDGSNLSLSSSAHISMGYWIVNSYSQMDGDTPDKFELNLFNDITGHNDTFAINTGGGTLHGVPEILLCTPATKNGFEVQPTTGQAYLNDDNTTSLLDHNITASAILELHSTTRGFLPPRLTTTQRNAISSPQTGLQLYNTTTNQDEFWNGSVWGAVGGGASFTPSVQAFKDTVFSTTSLSFVDTGLDAAFALASSAHKVKITLSLYIGVVNSNTTTPVLTVFVDNAQQSAIDNGNFLIRPIISVTTSGTLTQNVGYTILYSPGDTSSHTYSVQLHSDTSGSAVELSHGGVRSTLVLEEVI